MCTNDSSFINSYLFTQQSQSKRSGGSSMKEKTKDKPRSSLDSDDKKDKKDKHPSGHAHSSQSPPETEANIYKERILKDSIIHLELINAMGTQNIDAVLTSILQVSSTPYHVPSYGSPLHLVVGLCSKEIVEQVRSVLYRSSRSFAQNLALLQVLLRLNGSISGIYQVSII